MSREDRIKHTENVRRKKLKRCERKRDKDRDDEGSKDAVRRFWNEA